MVTLINIILGIVLEIIASLVLLPIRGLTILIHIFTKRPVGLRKPKNHEGKGPVILIHGLNMDEICMWYLRWCLKRENWGPLYILHLGPLSWTIEENAHLLARSIDPIFQKYGKVHLIAHSMGGLVSRYFIQELNGFSKVGSLITLASPHFGTPMAHLAWSVCGRQLIPGSAFLAQVNRKPFPQEVPNLFLWSNLDILVPPRWGGAIGFSPAEGNFSYIGNLGHLMILHSIRVFRVIREFLEKVNQTKMDSSFMDRAGNL